MSSYPIQRTATVYGEAGSIGITLSVESDERRWTHVDGCSILFTAMPSGCRFDLYRDEAVKLRDALNRYLDATKDSSK